MKTQCERLLDNLLQGFRINGLNAWQSLGIYRLGSRIHDLRSQGYPVKDNWIKKSNQFGEEVRFKEYYLEDDDIIDIVIERRKQHG